MSGSDDRTVGIWKMVSGEEIKKLAYKNSIKSLDISRSNKFISIGIENSNTMIMKIWTLN